MNRRAQPTEATLTEESTATVAGGLTRRLFCKYLLLSLPAVGATLLADKPEVAEASHERFWELDGNSLHSGQFLGSTNNQPLTFKTNNETRMTITDGGQVGIGTTTPFSAKVDVREPNLRGILVETPNNIAIEAIGTTGVIARSASLGINVFSGGMGVRSEASSSGVQGFGGSWGGVFRTTSPFGIAGVDARGGRFGVEAIGDQYGVRAIAGRDIPPGDFQEGAGVLGVVESTTIESINRRGIWGIHWRFLVGAPFGYAGLFDGDVWVRGRLSAPSNVSRIDHPLDPENKYLSHASVESPNMMNIYTGTVSLDANGSAVVELPSYFEAFNRDFTYQLTCIGGFVPMYIAEEIQNNHFTIAGGTPDMKVSWQVTGIRRDPYAEAHPIQAEEDKPDHERGTYLAPLEHGQPETKRTDYEQIQRAISGALSVPEDLAPIP